MRLPKFDYLKPRTVDEACSLLSEHKGEANVIAGSTALLTYIKHRLLTPKYVIGLKGIPGLDYINYDGKGGLKIGALTTLHALNTSPLIRERYHILSQAAAQVGVPPLRYMGTLGGNLCLDTRCLYYNQSYSWRRVRPLCFKAGGELCHVVRGGERCYAVYQGDLAPALIGLGAKVRLVRTSGERIIPLNEFFTGRGESPNILEPDEILTEVQIPPPPEQSCGAYHKLRIRRAMDFPLAGVAVVLAMDGKICREAKIILNAVSSAPFEVREAEEMLRGKRIGDGVIEEVAEEIFKRARPVANLSIDADYRRKMVRVLFKRAVKQALSAKS